MRCQTDMHVKMWREINGKQTQMNNSKKKSQMEFKTLGSQVGSTLHDRFFLMYLNPIVREQYSRGFHPSPIRCFEKKRMDNSDNQSL